MNFEPWCAVANYHTLYAGTAIRIPDDDGTPFNGDKGDFSWSELSVTRENGQWKGNLKVGKADAFHYEPTVLWRIMTEGGE